MRFSDIRTAELDESYRRVLEMWHMMGEMTRLKRFEAAYEGFHSVFFDRRATRQYL